MRLHHLISIYELCFRGVFLKIATKFSFVGLFDQARCDARVLLKMRVKVKEFEGLAIARAYNNVEASWEKFSSMKLECENTLYVQ